MLFNPVFINSNQNTQGSTKQNNFLGTSYLFSDIIKIYSAESGVSNTPKDYSNFFKDKGISFINGLFELKNSESLPEIINSNYSLNVTNNTIKENKTGNSIEEVLKLTEADLRNILFSLNYYPEAETGLINNESETTTDTSSYTPKVKEIFELLNNQNKVSIYVKDGNNTYKLDIIPEQTLSQDNNNKLAFSSNDLESLAKNDQIELKSGNNEVNSNIKFGGEKQNLTYEKNYEIKLTPLQNLNEEPEFIYFDNNIEDDLSLNTTRQKNTPVKLENSANLNKDHVEFTAKEIFTDQNMEQATDILDSQLKKSPGDFPVNKDEIEVKSGKSPIVENNMKTVQTDNFDSNKINSSYKNEVKPGNESLKGLGEIIKNYSDKDFEIKLDKPVNEIKTNPVTPSTKDTESQKDVNSFNFELGKNIKEFAIKGSIKDLNFKPETSSVEIKQTETRSEENFVQETGSKKNQLNNFEPAKNNKVPVTTEEAESQKIKQNNNIPIKETKEEESSSHVKVRDNTGNSSNEKTTVKIGSLNKSDINSSEDQNFPQKENLERSFKDTETEIEVKQNKNTIIDEKTKVNVKTQEVIKSFKEASSNLGSEVELEPEPLHVSSENLRSFAKNTSSLNTNRFTETIKNIPVSEIANEISSLIQKGEKKSLTIQLYPETLGKVKVILDLFNKQVTARIEVENEAAKQAVQTNLEHLKEAIHNQGVQLNSVFVSLSNEEHKPQRTPEVKRKSNHLSSDKKVEEQVEPKTLKIMGYNTYEYLA